MDEFFSHRSRGIDETSLHGSGGMEQTFQLGKWRDNAFPRGSGVMERTFPYGNVGMEDILAQE